MFTKLRKRRHSIGHRIYKCKVLDNTYKSTKRPSLERGHSLIAEFKVTFGTRTEGSVLWNDTPNTLVSDSIWQLESARDESGANARDKYKYLN